MEKAQEEMKSRYNKNVAKREIVIGDMVTIRNHHPDSKIEVKSFGPYKVTGLDKPNAILENPWVGKDSEFKMHLEDIFLFHRDSDTRLGLRKWDLL